jgi:ABC-type Mn2+/Zn2+ transport system permease subunit
MNLLEFLELPQMQRAFLIVLIAAPVCGLLGTFITLRRMSFFSDAISHGAMTGVTLGFALKIADDLNSPMMQVTLVVFCASIALLMAWLFEKTTLHTDSVIAFSYTGSVALGVILISRMQGYRVLEGALFGDILASNPADVWLIAGLALVILIFLFFNMRALTLCVVQENLARSEGFNTRRLNYLFVALIAIVVALLLRQLGALLISGLIVVPAAASRVVAGNFAKMLLLSALFGLTGAVAGVFFSYQFDAPTGPAIVLSDVIILTMCLLFAVFARRAKADPSLKPQLASLESK